MGKVAGKNCKVFKDFLTSVNIDSIGGVGTKTADILTLIGHGLTVGEWVRIENVTGSTQVNGFWKVITAPNALEFTINVKENIDIHLGGGSVVGVSIQPSYDFNINLSVDELDVTEMENDEWREFIAGFIGGDASYNYYKRTDELDVPIGSIITLSFVLGFYEVVVELVISQRNTISEINDVAKVEITGRITSAVSETIL